MPGAAVGTARYSSHGPVEVGTNQHDQAARLEVGRRIALLLGGHVQGESPDVRFEDPLAATYRIPYDTLILSPDGPTLDPQDFYGGVVPHSFVATKAIVHPLLRVGAAAPVGWNADLGHLLETVALVGTTAFTLDDARAAGANLLAKGAVRLKQVTATAGLGQEVVSSSDALEMALRTIDEQDLQASGLVLEEDLTDVLTYSVGVCQIRQHHIAYWGVQRLTPDNVGAMVYGGTTIHAVPGGLDALIALGLAPELKEAVMKAMQFEEACRLAYPSFQASRRNYDVILGTDSNGHRRIAVLEQSWRAGGATPAELVAFDAFARNPQLREIRASSCEIYGDIGAAPAGAIIYFAGIDPVVGPLSKYAVRDA